MVETWSRRRMIAAGIATLVGAPRLASLATATPAHAGVVPNLVENPSFEDGPVGTNIPNWTLIQAPAAA